MKSLIPFPDTEAFPAKNGSGYRSMAVIFAGFHTLPIYPFKKHYHGNEVYRTAGDGRTGITERNNPCPPNGSGGTAKGEKYENSLYWNPIPGIRNCAAISCGVWKNCPNCLPCHAKSTGHC